MFAENKDDENIETDKEVNNEEVVNDDLNSKTVDELKNIAKEKGIEGYSTLRKAELIEMIRKLG